MESEQTETRALKGHAIGGAPHVSKGVALGYVISPSNSPQSVMSETRIRTSLTQLLLLTVLGASLATYYYAVTCTALEYYYVRSVVASPRGKWLARVSSRGLVVFDLQSGKPQLTLNKAFAPSFSPDEHQIAIARTGSVEVWDLDTRKLLARVPKQEEYGDYADSIAFALDGTLAIYWGGAIERWNWHKLRRISAVSTPIGLGPDCTWSSDAHFVAIGGDSQSVKVWHLESQGSWEWMNADEKVPLRDLAFSPDEKTIAAALQDRIRLWERETGKPKAELPALDATSVAFSAMGDQIASVDHKGVVRVWRPDNDAVKIVERVGSGWVSDVRFVNNDKQLVIADQSGTVKIVTLAGNTETRELSGLRLPPPVPIVLWYVIAGVGLAWLVLWYRFHRAREGDSADRSYGDHDWHLVLVTTLMSIVIGMALVTSTSYLDPAVSLGMILLALLTLYVTSASSREFQYSDLCFSFSVLTYLVVLGVCGWLFVLGLAYRAG